MKAVLDTGVVVAAMFWRHEPYHCLVAFGRRRFSMMVSTQIYEEYRSIAWRLKQEEGLVANPDAWLNFIQAKAAFVDPVPLKKPTRRDAKDDKFLECAITARADYIVSRDDDLLVLGKPFGVEVVTPRRFLSILGSDPDPTSRHNPRSRNLLTHPASLPGKK
jgi:uncharacterized protein